MEPDLQQYENTLRSLASKTSRPAAKANGQVRVLLTGVPLVHGAERVLELIEDAGAVVDQTPCNNPLCVAPKHLQAKTQQKNIQRAADQGHMTRD
jgi:benzoyl-CoA reductase/2-hydroxyglutaryl-CoA dehydratase subunit BcrC/BadD/HgdB